MGWPQGEEAVMLALAHTATLHLQEELTFQNNGWNDPLVVPPLTMPRYISSEDVLQVRRLPALVVGSLGVEQRENGAYSAGLGWAQLDYNFSMVIYFRADKEHIGKRLARRYNAAIWRLLMRYQGLDGSTQSPSGIDLLQARTNWGTNEKQLTFATGWRGVVHLAENV